MCVVNPNKTEELTYFRSSHTRFYHHGRHSDRADVSKIICLERKSRVTVGFGLVQVEEECSERQKEFKILKYDHN